MAILTNLPFELSAEIIKVNDARKNEMTRGVKMMAKRSLGSTAKAPVKIILKIISSIPGIRVKSKK